MEKQTLTEGQETLVQKKRYKWQLLYIFLASELVMAYSALGYIDIQPIPLSLVPIIVVQGALYLGVRESLILGTVFGLTNMWRTGIGSVSYVDMVFSPPLSGKPLESILLSVVTRAMFGLIAGLLFQSIRKRKNYTTLDLLFATLLSLGAHGAIVYASMRIFFPEAFMQAMQFTPKSFCLHVLLAYVLPALHTVFMDRICHHPRVQELFSQGRRVIINRNGHVRKKRRVIVLASTLVTATVLILIHVYLRLHLVFQTHWILVNKAAWIAVAQILLQLFIALLAVFYIIYIVMIIVFEFSEVRKQENLKLSKALAEIEAYQKVVEQALEEARSASEAKTQFISRMSHDIRTPLNAIIGLSAIEMDNNKGKTENTDTYKKIWKSGNYLLGLVNDILDLSKIESESVELHNEPFSVSNCIDDIYIILREQIEEKQIYFSYCSRGLQTQAVWMDAMRFQQIFMNLISNSVKYNRVGGIIEVDSEMVEEEDDLIRITMKVRDSGVGMKPEFMKIMFEPYSQEEAKNESKGTGLGLAIVKNLVDMFHGTIEVKSKLDEGTEFVLVFHAKKATQEPGLTKKIQVEEQLLIGRRVLLVEDNLINIEVGSTLLKKKGIEVEVAQNGMQAVEQFMLRSEGYYDAILMDIFMPVMDGNKATRKIRSLDRTDASTIPIIAMTANALESDMKVSLESGMNDYLTKPIKPEYLYSTLAKWFCK